MKLTEIRDAVTDALCDYVGDYVVYLYQYGSLRFKIKGYKQYKDTCDDKFYEELDRSLGTMALNNLKFGSCVDGCGFMIEGTVSRHSQSSDKTCLLQGWCGSCLR